MYASLAYKLFIRASLAENWAIFPVPAANGDVNSINGAIVPNAASAFCVIGMAPRKLVSVVNMAAFPAEIKPMLASLEYNLKMRPSDAVNLRICASVPNRFLWWSALYASLALTAVHLRLEPANG